MITERARNEFCACFLLKQNELYIIPYNKNNNIYPTT